MYHITIHPPTHLSTYLPTYLPTYLIYDPVEERLVNHPRQGISGVARLLGSEGLVEQLLVDLMNR